MSNSCRRQVSSLLLPEHISDATAWAIRYSLVIGFLGKIAPISSIFVCQTRLISNLVNMFMFQLQHIMTKGHC